MVLFKSAVVPMAVFESALLNRSVPAPTAVLKPPLVSLKSEYQPAAVLPAPVVRVLRALVPSAVLNPGYPPSGAGTTACDFGKTVRHGTPRMTKISLDCRNRPVRELLTREVINFI